MDDAGQWKKLRGPEKDDEENLGRAEGAGRGRAEGAERRGAEGAGRGAEQRGEEEQRGPEPSMGPEEEAEGAGTKADEPDVGAASNS